MYDQYEVMEVTLSGHWYEIVKGEPRESYGGRGVNQNGRDADPSEETSETGARLRYGGWATPSHIVWVTSDGGRRVGKGTGRKHHPAIMSGEYDDRVRNKPVATAKAWFRCFRSFGERGGFVRSPRGYFSEESRPRPRRGYFSDKSRRRRGRDVDISRKIAATPRP